jgi:pimeloyl-ACP methyl ester carboxylesterase
MALLGVEGPDDTVKLPAHVDSVLAEIEVAHPGLLATVRTLLGRLQDAPWTKTLPNGQRVTVGAWDLQRRIAEALSTVRTIDALPAALAGMMDGDYSDLVRWTIPFRIGRPLNLMNVAMDCASFASAGRLDRVRAQAPVSVLGAAMNFPLPDICDVPGLPRLADGFRAPLTSTVPALLVAGTWDARTPPANARAAAASLPHAELLIVPRVSHDLFQHADVSAAVTRFLAHGRE